jgi:hypothetical protein
LMARCRTTLLFLRIGMAASASEAQYLCYPE